MSGVVPGVALGDGGDIPQARLGETGRHLVKGSGSGWPSISLNTNGWLFKVQWRVKYSMAAVTARL